MIKYPVLVFLSMALFSSCTNQNERSKTETQHTADKIFSKGERITNNNFKGNAWLKPLVENDTLLGTQVGNVTFEPGARTNWHLHPGGQILLATAGTGYYQERGSPQKILRKGDVIRCPPNTPHWHGASHDDHFIQIAITITRNGPTVWLEPVTDEEYDNVQNRILTN